MEIQFPEKNSPDQAERFLKLIPPFAAGLFCLILVLWAASGFYIIGPGEVGVIRRFGKEVAKTNPGLRYRLPWPVDVINIVNIEQVRRAEIGFRSYQAAVTTANQRVSEEALMLTGDENIVEAQIIVQYQVKDPSFYLFNVHQPEGVLHTSTEVALRSVVGSMVIDDLLTVGRERVQIETRDFLQRLLDAYNTGLRVTEVRLQVVDPPEQVKDAFHEVVRAREDRERLINQAEGYREDLIPKARGQAQQMIRAAEAYKEERVLKARGDSERFLELLEEYQKAKTVTRTRLHLETIERIFHDVDKTIIDAKVSEKVSAILPIGELGLRESKGTSR
ncbi:MAG: FtsH protease activity modulator HflK [Candidatus Omnitrophota bacterium]